MPSDTKAGNDCGLTILIVDDDPDMRFLARSVLERGGMHSSICVSAEAADGPEALARLAELEPPPVPTVILLDNQMPGPSGLEIAEQILATLPEQIIVLFSAYLNDEIEAQAARLGVAACVSKSDALELPQIIERVVADRR